MAKVLIYVAVGIVALVVSVTVSVLTYRFMDRGNRTRQFPVISDDYETEIPQYAYFDFLTGEGYDLRTQTADPERYSFAAKIKLGYDDTQYKNLNSELTQKNDPMMDTIRFFFSQKTAKQLQNEEAIKRDLLSRLNSLLSMGRIEEVIFLEYQILGF
jgi:flagellar basal body-associated protein FliL